MTDQEPMIERISWQKFRDWGMLQLVNMALNFFGLSIVVDLDEEGEIVDVYPVRTKFRGFDEGSNSECYRRVSAYMRQNALDLEKEANT